MRSFIKKGKPESKLEVWLMDGLRSKQFISKILVADDDPWVLRAVADRCVQMGFDVETATNGLQVLIKVGEYKPDLLVIDVHLPEVDGLSALAYLSDAAKKLPRLMVMTGRRSQEVVETCVGLDAACIHKGPLFWSEFELRLSEMFPHRAVAIKRSVQQVAYSEVKETPRVLLVDDDVNVKKLFFHRFDKLGAELIYASDAPQGYWKARREQPTVIVADFCMPNGDAEYLMTKLRMVPETSDIPVIVQTGRRLSDVVKHRLQQQIDGKPGVARILQKSFDGQELFEALRRFCGFAGNLNGELLYQ